MDIFSIITVIGGLAFFLYGMSVMSGGLERMAGGKLESSLKKMSSNPMKGLALGMGITIAIQSSSAMTVMLVGLVNSNPVDNVALRYRQFKSVSENAQPVEFCTDSRTCRSNFHNGVKNQS